jgi:hypothetical protein
MAHPALGAFPVSYTPFSETDDETGITLKIESDDDGGTESPLEHDSAVIMGVLHNRYQNPARKHDLHTQADLERFERENCAGKSAPWVAFPLFMIDHSGTAYRVSDPAPKGERPVNPFACPWDSGRVGTLFVKLSEIAKRNTPRAEKLAQARKSADITCEVYTAWANGEVYGFVIEDAEGEHLDSCWGFIGAPDDEYLMSTAREQFDYYKAKARKALAESTAEELTDSRPDLYA